MKRKENKFKPFMQKMFFWPLFYVTKYFLCIIIQRCSSCNLTPCKVLCAHSVEWVGDVTG